MPQTRDLGAVKLSLDYLSTRTVGELNVAFRTTLDAFSYRLDAWISGARQPPPRADARREPHGGIYVGGYAWVENLKADTRPDSEGYLLAPSLGQAATAAILRSGFMANHEQGAFDIALDSQRTQRAADILQGLTRDQPLAALYGYRIERALARCPARPLHLAAAAGVIPGGPPARSRAMNRRKRSARVTSSTVSPCSPRGSRSGRDRDATCAIALSDLRPAGSPSRTPTNCRSSPT